MAAAPRKKNILTEPEERSQGIQQWTRWTVPTSAVTFEGGTCGCGGQTFSAQDFAPALIEDILGHQPLAEMKDERDTPDAIASGHLCPGKVARIPYECELVEPIPQPGRRWLRGTTGTG